MKTDTDSVGIFADVGMFGCSDELLTYGNTCVTFNMLDVREYLDANGRSPFADWFADLDATAAAKVTVAIARIGQEALSAFKGVGSGVLEYRIDFGPGYRVYFGLAGDTLMILLGGGTKKRQQRDIEVARSRWTAYKRRKRQPR